MAKNNLKPEQDLMFRDFFRMVAGDESILANDPAGRRALLASCLNALNYVQLPNGAFVEQGTNYSIPFGTLPEEIGVTDEWPADEERARAAIDSKDKPQASTRKSSKNTKVR